MFQPWQSCTADNNGYAIGVIWGKNCFFLFDPQRKNSIGNICQNGTSVLLKSETLNKLQEYVNNIYYIGLKHETLYFQIQFINLLCSSKEMNKEMKVIKSKVGLERCLNFPKKKKKERKKKKATNLELKKKNHQSKLYAPNTSSVAKKEKLKRKKKKKWRQS